MSAVGRDDGRSTGSLRMRIWFVTGLGLLRRMVEPDDLDAILTQAQAELNDPHRWGITFTLTQMLGPAPVMSAGNVVSNRRQRAGEAADDVGRRMVRHVSKQLVHELALPAAVLRAGR